MIRLIAGKVWEDLAHFAKRNKGPVDVAAPYFAKSGAKLLHIPRGSRVVVNASEGNVKAGAVHPDDLLELTNRGVTVYHHSNLHAKVYAFKGRAYIGSANVSKSSAGLEEALVCTTDADVVADAKVFVRGLCHEELAPLRLKQLQKIDRPPKGLVGAIVKGGNRTRRHGRLCIAPLSLMTWTEEEEREDQVGKKVARKTQRHAKVWELQSFIWTGTAPFRKGDRVIEILEESPGVRWVSRPRPILHVHAYRTSRGVKHHVYIERQVGERRQKADKLAKKLGRGGKKILCIKGSIRNREHVGRLERLFSVGSDV